MASRAILSRSTEETIQKGRELGAALRAPALVLLSGDLGAGKTTLAKGIIAGLGAAQEDEVTSPTFTLVHVFPGASTKVSSSPRVYHIDLYRITDARDLESLGLEDALASPAVALVEWPERWTLRTDWPVVRIRLEHVDEHSRRIEVDAPGALLSALAWAAE